MQNILKDWLFKIFQYGILTQKNTQKFSQKLLEFYFLVSKLNWVSRKVQAFLEQNEAKIGIYMSQNCVINWSEMSEKGWAV